MNWQTDSETMKDIVEIGYGTASLDEAMMYHEQMLRKMLDDISGGMPRLQERSDMMEKGHGTDASTSVPSNDGIVKSFTFGNGYGLDNYDRLDFTRYGQTTACPSAPSSQSLPIRPSRPIQPARPATSAPSSPTHPSSQATRNVCSPLAVMSLDADQLSGCESQTAQLIASYNTILSKMYTLSERELKSMDLSCLGCFLTKIVEIEFNASLVQMLRHCCGIEMPQYYNKPKPGTIVYIKTSKTDIHLNKTDSDGRLETITLGNAFHAYRCLRDNGRYYYVGSCSSRKGEENCKCDDRRLLIFGREFDELCTRFYQIRNACIAHTGQLTYADFREQHGYFKTFTREYMPKLMAKKEELKKNKNNF